MPSVKSIGEDQLIRLITPYCPQRENVIVGPGDDCAVLQSKHSRLHTLLKTDTIIEGVHFLPAADPYWVGWKAVARVVSDFAAMAGAPDSLVISLALKEDTQVEYVKNLYRGMQHCAETYHFSIVGGETSSSPANVITVSGLGSAQQPILRSGAKTGHSIYVTGSLGNSLSGKHLTFQPRVDEAQWLAEHTSLSAMMDISDGIAKDLPRLANSSRVGFHLEADKIPCNKGATIENALTDGEDYELLFTLEEAMKEDILQAWQSHFPHVRLSHIGTITESERSDLSGGWEHFTA